MLAEVIYLSNLTLTEYRAWCFGVKSVFSAHYMKTIFIPSLFPQAKQAESPQITHSA